MGRAKRNLLSLHRKIAKDNAATIKANSPGGRYYKATTADKIAAATGRKPDGEARRLP